MKNIRLFIIPFLFSHFCFAQETYNPQAGQLNAILYHQTSGEYKALCYQAYNIARIQLEKILNNCNGTKERLAIITDLDETVLDNSPQSAFDFIHKNNFSEAVFNEWIDRAAAESMPGAKAFFNYASQMGVSCFYISNRKKEGLGSTILNLRRLGFPDADSVHVLLRTNTSDKETRRNIVREGYKVVLLLGDNLNDFDAQYFKKTVTERNQIVDMEQNLFGIQFIVLPNSIYGDWENALYQYKSYSDKQRDSVKLEYLRTFK